MNGRFTITPLPLPGLVRLERHARRDSRGLLERMFCEADLEGLLPLGERVVQVNRTQTQRPGTVRGLHFQRPPHADTKIVSCLRGAVFDVAVDVRPHSPTFLHWHAERLSEAHATSLVIPPGCAHGFQVLEADSELLYFHSAAWHPPAEDALHPQDPALEIVWPREVSELSRRDQGHRYLADRDLNTLFSSLHSEAA
jgi:dTDP-4-dehydrorhamnose 3,5-epimerase